MSIRCCLVHAIRGRVRIRVDPPLLLNGFGHAVQAFLQQQPGIREVRLNAGCSSIILVYEPDLREQEQLVSLVEEAPLDQLTEGRLAAEPSPRPARRATPRPGRCQVVHATPGRVRIRVDIPGLLDSQGPSLEAFLRKQPGVEDVRLNPACRSVILQFDPASRTAEQWVELIEQLRPEVLADYTPTSPAPQAAPVKPASARGFVLATATVGLGLFSRSSLVYWLLLQAASPIFHRAVRSLVERKKLNVDVLDAAATLTLLGQRRYGTAAFMIWLISLGDYIRNRTVRRSREAIHKLFDDRGRQAWVVRDGREVQIPVEEVRRGDEVVVYPGELISVDGKIRSGKAAVDQKMLTGESLPIDKGEGDRVYAGTVVREGEIRLKVEEVGSETMASKIVRLILDAPVHETRVQQYGERFADRFVPWSFLGAGLAWAATRSVDLPASLLIVDFGTGIRVAAPTTVLSSMTRAARHGILIKGGRYLETLAEVDTVVFDKTGTLTTGVPEIVDIVSYDPAVSAEQVLTLAAAAESRMTHPVAEAVLRAARQRGLVIPEHEASEYTIGQGVKAPINGSLVLAGSRHFMAAERIDTSRAHDDLREADRRAASCLFVAADGKFLGLLTYSDPLRPEAPQVVEALRRLGVRDVIMLTGDGAAAARTVAEAAGIGWYVAEVFPRQKLEFVRSLQQEGRTVALVGDGINDSPALAQADVGIAVDGGADVAQQTAHVRLMETNLWKIPQAVEIARETMDLIEQNWRLNFYPGCTALGLSALGWVGPIGVTLISNGAAVLATLNALRPLLAGVTPGSR